MSNDTEFRPQAGPRHASDGATTTAIPRPTGPWTPSPVVLGPPRGAQGPQPMWQGRPPMWSVPPAGLGPVAPGVPTPSSRPRLRAGWVVIAIVAAIAAVALIGTVAANRTMTVTGSVAVYGWGTLTPGTACSINSAEGMPVTIYDAVGQLVGTTTLRGGGIAQDTWNSSSYGYADSCVYSFTISDVDATNDWYRVKSGSDSGDGVGFSREQLETSGAHITRR